jgi:hypothetical protein
MGRRGQRRRRTETPLAETLSGALGFYESADDADGRRWREGQLEPVKKLQSAALLLDFWLGQGVRAAGIPAAVLSRPSNAGQAKKTRNPVGESKKGRLAALPARLQPAAGMRPRVRLAIRPFLLLCGAF